MLLAEDLLLLLTDDESGKLLASGSYVDVALGGANLIDLTLAERVDLTQKAEGRPGRLVVRDPSATGDRVLDDALRVIHEHEGRNRRA